MKIFISYRRSDASAAGLLLATTLKAHFGDENVFFDTRDLEFGGKRVGAEEVHASFMAALGWWYADLVRAADFVAGSGNAPRT